MGHDRVVGLSVHQEVGDLEYAALKFHLGCAVAARGG
jgi:hypothetical protein